MRIQSAGRLGNILFIWAFAQHVAREEKLNKVTVFADKYHTSVNSELLDVFNLLETETVKFEIKNNLGLLLKAIDKLDSHHPSAGAIFRKIFHIKNEQNYQKPSHTWILRGYFQEEENLRNIGQDIWSLLNQIVESRAPKEGLIRKFPYLSQPYQAVHIRLTDFVGSEFGVVSPASQTLCLDENPNVVICTDGTYDEVAERINIDKYHVLTPENSSSWETLAILGNANNLITTNSTFSWWSGFLASRKGNNVWAPTHWNPAKTNTRKLPSSYVKNYEPVFE